MKRFSKNFTMIELIVVITIIAILAAILMPALISARRKAKSITCVNRQKQIATTYMLYADDFNSYAFTGPEWATGLIPEAIVSKYRASQLAWGKAPLGQGYIRGEEMLFCPEGKLANLNDAIVYGSKLSPSINTPFTLTTIGTIRNPHSPLGNDPLPISFKRLINPSTNVLGGDNGKLNGSTYEHSSSIVMNDAHITMRHDKRANIFMADGHVSNVDKELKDYYFFNFRGSIHKDVKFTKAIKKEVEYNLN